MYLIISVVSRYVEFTVKMYHQISSRNQLFFLLLKQHCLDDEMHILLCSWHVLISMPAGGDLDIPYSLKATEETPLDQVCGRNLSYYLFFILFSKIVLIQPAIKLVNLIDSQFCLFIIDFTNSTFWNC